MSLNNLANRQAETGNQRAALTAVTEAVSIRRTLAQEEPAAHLANLAASLSNLGIQQAEAGNRKDALSTITEAVDLHRTLARQDPATCLPSLAATLNNLANCQAGAGDRRNALTTITEAVDLYRTLAQQNPAAHLPNLATCLVNLAGLAPAQTASAAYTSAERAFSAYPRTTRLLAVRRAELELASISTDLGIRSLISVAHPPQDSETTDSAAFEARLRLRALHQGDTVHPSQVATLWREETGTEPLPWLALPPAALDLAAQWISCPTWAGSRTFWDAHTDELRSAETVLALEELSLVTEGADLYLGILRSVEDTDADSAFRPFRTGELLDTWLSRPTSEESLAYLTEHQEVLLHDQAFALLGSDLDAPRSAVPLALLALARADGIPAAYRYAEDRPALAARLQRVLAAPDAEPALLQAIALLELFVHGQEFTGFAHNVLANALRDTPVDPPADWPPAEPGERDRILSEIAALIRLHPRHAAALGALLQSLLAG
ncbi:hypothetical protein ACWGE1_39505 [Streptomyces sp. NPDC054932]